MPAAYRWSRSSRRGGCRRRSPLWRHPTPTARRRCAASSTKLHEQVERGRLADLAERFATPPKGEVTLVVAAAQARADTDVPAAALAELAAAVGTRRAAELGSRLTGLPRNRLYQALTKP